MFIFFKWNLKARIMTSYCCFEFLIAISQMATRGQHSNTSLKKANWVLCPRAAISALRLCFCSFFSINLQNGWTAWQSFFSFFLVVVVVKAKSGKKAKSTLEFHKTCFQTRLYQWGNLLVSIAHLQVRHMQKFSSKPYNLVRQIILICIRGFCKYTKVCMLPQSELCNPDF